MLDLSTQLSATPSDNSWINFTTQHGRLFLFLLTAYRLLAVWRQVSASHSLATLRKFTFNRLVRGYGYTLPAYVNRYCLNGEVELHIWHSRFNVVLDDVHRCVVNTAVSVSWEFLIKRKNKSQHLKNGQPKWESRYIIARRRCPAKFKQHSARTQKKSARFQFSIKVTNAVHA